jgi:hypothetical protein
MKTSIKYSFIIIALFLQGCRGCKTTTVAPATGLTSYCTTTEQIYNLKKDMSVNDVNTILGVPPTDIYINSEMSLRGGEEMFRDEANLFVIFDANSNKLLYYVTDKGRKEAKDLIGKSIELKYSNQ